MISPSSRLPKILLAMLAGLLSLWVASFAMAAQDSAERILDASRVDQSAVPLTEYTAVLEDASLNLRLADVQKPEVAARFNWDSSAAEAFSFGFTRSAYWLRVHLRNSSDLPIERMLEIANARLSTVQFHQALANGADQSVVTGAVTPFATRPYANRFFIFPLSLPAHSDQVYYLRFESVGPLLIPARLWTPQAYHAHERSDYLAQAWYFGMATAMVLFNLLLFFALRDVLYLLYVNFVTCTTLTLAAQNGLAKEFLWPDAALWSDTAVPVGFSMTLLTLLFFMRHMLDTRIVVPRLDRLIQALIAIFLLSLIAFAVALPLFAKTAVQLNLVTALLTIAIGLACAFKSQRSAWFFVAAFAALMLGGVLTALRSFGFLPTNFLTVNGLQFGSALEMILLALAMADRFDALRKEKASAQSKALEAQLETLQAEQRVIETLRWSERVLEDRVSERTAELSATVDRLKQTQHDLVQAEKLASLGALVAGVAHELNTPIGIALTTASTLEDNAKDFQRTVEDGSVKRSSLDFFVQKSVDMGALLVRSCHRAADLISSFKQVAVDQTSEQQRQFDLRSLVEDNVVSLRPSFKQPVMNIEIEVPNGINCNSYPGPLGQVLVNLIQNADLHAFAPDEQGTLRITASVVADMVELIITDNGKGMDEETAARIFEPFFTTRLGQGGSGLGLAICRNIVKGVLGGSLLATSAPGAGSRFVVSFPITASPR